jgi:hypothetical protein
MWAWRTLAGVSPFPKEEAKGDRQKYIVLMTDGENMIGANNKTNTSGISDYTAYGYLFQKRLGTDKDYDKAAIALDKKMQDACKGAKDAGITVMTILFRETSLRAIENVQSCASPGNFYRATDEKSLQTAFQDVASKISNLRISD